MPANLAVLTAALEPEGYEILAAPSGAAALKIAPRARPDLILLDILMPELDGLETCRRLKQDATTRDIPVIFSRRAARRRAWSRASARAAWITW